MSNKQGWQMVVSETDSVHIRHTKRLKVSGVRLKIPVINRYIRVKTVLPDTAIE